MSNKEDIASEKQLLALERLRTKNQRAAHQIELLRKKLAKDATLSLEEQVKLEQLIVDIRQESLAARKEEDRLNRILDKQYKRLEDLANKPLKNFLLRNKYTEKYSDKLDEISEKYEDQLDSIGAMTKEMHGWGKHIGNAYNMLKNMTSDKEANTFLERTGQVYYRNIRNAAELYKNLQGEFRESETTITSDAGSWFATLGMGTSEARNQISGMASAMGDLRDNLVIMEQKAEAFNKRTALGEELIKKTSTELAIVAKQDLGTEENRNAVQGLTEQFLILKNKGMLPAEASAEDLAQLMMKFGGTGTKDIDRLTKQLTRLSRLPDIMAKQMPGLGRFISTNKQELLPAILKLNQEIGNQATNLEDLGYMYTVLAASAKKYGAASKAAQEISESLIRGVSESNDKLQAVRMDVGEKIANEIRNNANYALELAKKINPTAKEEELKNIAEGLKSYTTDGYGYTKLVKVLSGQKEVQAALLKKTAEKFLMRGSHIDEDIFTDLGYVFKDHLQLMQATQLVNTGKIEEAIALAEKETIAATEGPQGAANREKDENALLLLEKALNPIDGTLKHIEEVLIDSRNALGVIAVGLGVKGVTNFFLARQAKKIKLPGGGDGPGGSTIATETAGEITKKGVKEVAKTTTAETTKKVMGGFGGAAAAVAKKKAEEELAKATAKAGEEILEKTAEETAKKAPSMLSRGAKKIFNKGILGKLGAGLALGFGAKEIYDISQEDNSKTNKALKMQDTAVNTAANFTGIGRAIMGLSLGASAFGQDDLAKSISKDLTSANLIKGGINSAIPGLGTARSFATSVAKVPDWLFDTNLEENIRKYTDLQSLAEETQRGILDWFFEEKKATQERKEIPKASPPVNVKNLVSQNQITGGSGDMTSTQTVLPGDLTGSSTTKVASLNDDGSLTLNYDLVIPNFKDAVFKANREFSNRRRG